MYVYIYTYEIIFLMIIRTLVVIETCVWQIVKKITPKLLSTPIRKHIFTLSHLPLAFPCRNTPPFPLDIICIVTLFNGCL